MASNLHFGEGMDLSHLYSMENQLNPVDLVRLHRKPAAISIFYHYLDHPQSVEPNLIRVFNFYKSVIFSRFCIYFWISGPEKKI